MEPEEADAILRDADPEKITDSVLAALVRRAQMEIAGDDAVTAHALAMRERLDHAGRRS